MVNLPVKILIIGVIRRQETLLLRKKFSGSKPYTETWYSFGCEFEPGIGPASTYIKYIRKHIGIDIAVKKHISWDSEMLEDHDGVLKQFLYLELEFEHLSGEPKTPKELERVAWIQIADLAIMDIVPPSVELFRRIGNLK